MSGPMNSIGRPASDPTVMDMAEKEKAALKKYVFPYSTTFSCFSMYMLEDCSLQTIDAI
jgi:hypothetical protein